MQHLRKATVFSEEKSKCKHIPEWQPEAHLTEIFILFHEEVCSENIKWFDKTAAIGYFLSHH
jgi:hypothetical protein